MFQLSKDKKILLSNFFSLSALQGVNMILPLILLPYLVRVLGVEKFGLINFALSIVMYFNILVSFGFELSATREISINRDDSKKVNEIFSSVLLIKASLAFISLFILSCLLFLIDSLSENYQLYYATFGIVIGNLMFPTWFFQGIERMKHITYVKVITRILFTVFIFMLVKEDSDFILVPLLNSVGSIVAGAYALYIIFKYYTVKLIIPNKEMVVIQMKNSAHFFLSRLANNGSRYYATTLVGMFFGNVMVGYYVMVEKLFYAFMSLGGIITQTLYPYMSRTQNIKFFRKVLFTVTIAALLLLVALMVLHEKFLYLIYDVNNEILSDIFLIVFSGAIFGIVSALLGYPLLAAFGYIKEANNSLIYASLIYVIYISLVTFFSMNIFLVASSLFVYNIIGLSFRSYYVHKYGLLKINK